MDPCDGHCTTLEGNFSPASGGGPSYMDAMWCVGHRLRHAAQGRGLVYLLLRFGALAYLRSLVSYKRQMK